jgi:hypothetical protein
VKIPSTSPAAPDEGLLAGLLAVNRRRWWIVMAEEISRRSLIKTAAARVVLPVTAFSYSPILGANDRIQIGQIGCGTDRRNVRAPQGSTIPTIP